MKISRNHPCPCGSGKKYKHCCLNVETEEVTVPITDEMREILEREKTRFKEIMGREPEDNDPIFVSGLNFSEETYKEIMVERMMEVGIDPAIIYAFNKLGFVLVQGRNYTEDQTESWNDAIDEYEDICSGKIEIEEDPVAPVMELLAKDLERLRTLYQLILRGYSGSEKGVELFGTIDANDYIAFCLTRNVKTIKAIDILLENHFGEDALNLTRTNFENYLEIVYAKYDAQELLKYLLFDKGVNKGTHKRQGKMIIDLKTGEKVKALNNYEKAALNPLYKEEDAEVYKDLYDFLSSYTHPDLSTAANYIHDDFGFSDLSRNMKNESLMFLLVINLFILNEIKDTQLPGTYKKDVERLVKDLGTNFKKLIDLMPDMPLSIVTRVNKTMEHNQ